MCGVGFVAHIKGQKSRSIVDEGLGILARLSHRAATGADPLTGDGAGIQLQLPEAFFRAEGERLGFALPARRRFAVGNVFLPPDRTLQAACEGTLEKAIRDEGQEVIGWRDVPIDRTACGTVAREVMPVFRQVFIRMKRVPPSAYERTLFVIRKLAENRIRDRKADPAGFFHVASLSTETIVYKGLLLPTQLPKFFLDLQDPRLTSAIAVVHSRFSTNTFPTWDLAQPFRYIAHNGEINTLRGNVNWMQARKSQLQSAKFSGGLDRLFPIIVPGKSDSAQFDNMLELLALGGRSLPHAMMMMIPEAVTGEDRDSFYQYASSLVEPWDGPAAIVFSDGKLVGATLDRNGLRPARWTVTTDDRVILASETGVAEIPPERVRQHGRLTPGTMFVVDTDEGKIVADADLKRDVTARFPYRAWLQQNVYEMEELEPATAPVIAGEELRVLQRAFGYTDEDVELVLEPMAKTGKEPVGSMGTDTPLAVLSERAPALFAYFHQLFAQVTNPPIDPIREALVMSLETSVGPDGNTFDETPEQCAQLRLRGPIVDNDDLARIRGTRDGMFDPTTLSLVWPLADGAGWLERALAALCRAAVRAIDDGHDVLILSDRGVDATQLPVPALLALSAVQQHLVREGIRMRAGLIVETAEVREVHDVALLIGYGAAAVNPYLALDTVGTPARRTALIHAYEEGLLKVMSKVGIATVQSYRGAQCFEAVGLDRDLVDTHFTGTATKLGGVGLDELGDEAVQRHARGFGLTDELLPVGGYYRWRRTGEVHKWSPQVIAALQDAVRRQDADVFAEFERLCDDESAATVTLRSLLELVPGPAVELEAVEPVSAIVARFVTGAMSFGSISAEAHETLAIAMNRLGGKSNSGEGGEEPHRFTADANGDLRRSAIKQVASGRFGVTPHYLVNAEDLQIKIAQGAKPGEGGQLPGQKVDERIAAVRNSTPGVMLISPPPHHDIYSIEDLAQLVFDLQTVNPTARVSVKLVSEVGIGAVAAGVAKARAGCVVVAGYEGGTGAAALSSVKRAGLPWELGLAEAQQVLVANRLRGRVRVQVDGGLRTSRDVVVAALLGAEEFGMATASLVATGCVMLRKCHLNTCSVGIATQDPALRAKFTGKPEDVIAYFTFVAEGVRRHLAHLGVTSLDAIIGRVDRLKIRTRALAGKPKLRALDLSAIVAAPVAPADTPRRFVAAEPWDVSTHGDHDLIPSLGSTPVVLERTISNRDRAAGTLLSGEIARRHGERGMPDGSITVRYRGTAGQSFGAFLAPGVALELAGEANDYIGKGMAGGRIAVRPPPAATYAADANVIIGNVALYGATGGELFAAGLAGERFAVRNSGARAVVEGVGDHGCEYMTGGTVVVLGPVGRNFAAGMSGGIAYIWDPANTLAARCNRELVELESVRELRDPREVTAVKTLVEDHAKHTGSVRAQTLLADWPVALAQFVRVIPTDYKRALAARRPAQLAVGGP